MMRSVRDWYLLSSGSRGRFFQEMAALTPEALITLLQTETAEGPTGALRTIEAITKYKRRPVPGSADVRTWKPNEQTLQYFFMNRGFFRNPTEVVIMREYPSCGVGERRPAVIDLLVFDTKTRSPLIVELKQGKATDPLMGVIFEVLHHWVFFTRYIRLLRDVLRSAGHECHDECAIQVAISAPHDYFVQTKRRAETDRTRNQEYDRALEFLTALKERIGLGVSLVSVNDDWHRAEDGLHLETWWEASDGPRR